MAAMDFSFCINLEYYRLKKKIVILLIEKKKKSRNYPILMKFSEFIH